MDVLDELDGILRQNNVLREDGTADKKSDTADNKTGLVLEIPNNVNTAKYAASSSSASSPYIKINTEKHRDNGEKKEPETSSTELKSKKDNTEIKAKSELKEILKGMSRGIKGLQRFMDDIPD